MQLTKIWIKMCVSLGPSWKWINCTLAVISKLSLIFLEFRSSIKFGKLYSIRKELSSLHIPAHLPPLLSSHYSLSFQASAPLDSSPNLSVDICNLWESTLCLLEPSVVIISCPCLFTFKIFICCQDSKRVQKEVSCSELQIVFWKKQMIMEFRCWSIFKIAQLTKEKQEYLGNLFQNSRKISLAK